MLFLTLALCRLLFFNVRKEMESLREEQTAEESDRFVLYRKLRPLDFKADSKEKKKEILLLLQNPYYRLHVRCLAR